MLHWVGLACWLRRVLPTSWVDPPLELAVVVLALVAPPFERIHWVPPLEAPLGVAVSADEEELGVLVTGLDHLQLICLWKLWLLGAENGVAGGVEAGSLEEPTVKRGYLAQLQPQKISVSGVLALPAGILGGIGTSCLSVRRLSLLMWRLRRLRG